MRPYSVDEFWAVLTGEYHCAGRGVPWLDRAWYHLALGWLKWRIRSACRRRR